MKTRATRVGWMFLLAALAMGEVSHTAATTTNRWTSSASDRWDNTNAWLLRICPNHQEGGKTVVETSENPLF